METPLQGDWLDLVILPLLRRTTDFALARLVTVCWSPIIELQVIYGAQHGELRYFCRKFLPYLIAGSR